MNVSLSTELEKLVQAKVQSGRYKSASEVVSEALLLLDRHDRQRVNQIAQLRSRMDEGLAALDRGEGVDGEKFMKGILDELDCQEAKRKAG